MFFWYVYRVYIHMHVVESGYFNIALKQRLQYYLFCVDVLTKVRKQYIFKRLKLYNIKYIVIMFL